MMMRTTTRIVLCWLLLGRRSGVRSDDDDDDDDGGDVATTSGGDFSDTYLYVSPAATQVPVTFQISFVPKVALNASDAVWITLPRFTSGLGTKRPGPDLFDLHFAPSIYFKAQWLEGDFHTESDPFRNSTLLLTVKPGRWLEAGRQVDAFVYDTNGIRVYCGFDAASSAFTATPGFLLRTNSSAATGASFALEDSDMVGNGCEAMLGCLGRGSCDYCGERCLCYEKLGDGDDTDKFGTRSIDCTLTNCPRGLGFSGMPVSATRAHFETECSNAGLCESQVGQCECFDGFTGIACERLACVDECNGHGQCLTMRAIAHLPEALPLSSATDVIYGTTAGQQSGAAWDFDSITGCVCDSAWPVGLGAGQRHLPQYFGPDCSLERCASGDDPATRNADETDCSNGTAAGHPQSQPGALCHVDCANRGTCDHTNGHCDCYPGYHGTNCDRLIRNGRNVRLN